MEVRLYQKKAESSSFCPHDTKGGHADDVELAQDGRRFGVGRVFGLDTDQHEVAAERLLHVAVMECHALHGGTVAAPGRPEIEEHRLLGKIKGGEMIFFHGFIQLPICSQAPYLGVKTNINMRLKT